MYLVYLLKEKVTRKVIYVGSSARPASRMKEHMASLRGDKPQVGKLYDYMLANGLKFYKDVEVVWVDIADNRASMLKLEAEYYEKYKATLLNDRPAENKDGAYNPKRRCVKCLDDGMEFETVSECARYYGYKRTTLSSVLHGYRTDKFGKKFLFNGKEV